MTHDEQLERWLAGDPVHDEENGECCPDLSCCRGDIAPLQVRQRFVAAYRDGDTETVYAMLGFFLSAALADFGESIHIAGVSEGEA